MTRLGVVFMVFYFLCLNHLFALPIIRGRFLSDSVKLGEPVRYCLSAIYEENELVVFPDTLDGFMPFEVIKREYFPTKIVAEGRLYDSAVYLVRTFSMDSMQSLSPLMVFYRDDDSLGLQVQEAKVSMDLSVGALPAVIKMKEEVGLQPLKRLLPPWFYVAVSAVFFVVVGLLLVFFRNPLKRGADSWRKRRQYRKFSQRFDQLALQDGQLSATIFLWKRWLQEMEGMPIPLLTTHELAQHFGEEPFVDVLRQADRVIYGSSQEQPDLTVLREFAKKRFLDPNDD